MAEAIKEEAPVEEQAETKQEKQEAPEPPKAESAPVTQTDDTAEQLKALRAENARLLVEREVMTQATTLGVDAKTVPYLCRLADLSGAVDEKGAVNQKAVTDAVKKVLDDLPGLKKPPEQSGGFRPIGGSGQKYGTDTNNKAPATKRWNRFR